MPSEWSLIPKLKDIKVRTGSLYLDPNNPRLMSRQSIRYEDAQICDQNVQAQTLAALVNGEHQVEALKRSIRQNGWQPVDSIFVRRLAGERGYVALEGNRRLAAIRTLLEETNLDPELRKSLTEIDVMEVISDGTKESLDRQVSYLLGVRHHGSLKRWSKYAQAENIYRQYLALSAMTSESFAWSREHAKTLGDALSVDLEKIEAAIRVYRVMEQIAGSAQMAKCNGKMSARHYSLIEELVKLRTRHLKTILAFDEAAFRLGPEALDSVVDLCAFQKPGREGSPIKNPQEWRKLNAILADDNPVKREEMCARVLKNREVPSDVYAERLVELRTETWSHWLSEVGAILSRVTLDKADAPGAAEVLARLRSVLARLDSAVSGGPNGA